jgi:hypothetical protein
LRRDPLFLAQSLLLARKFIHGSFETAYGVDNPEKTPDGAGDCFQDVCGQVAYHEHLERRQLDAIGPDRFWVVDYEDFCRAPSAVVARVATYLGQDADAAIQLEPFSVSRARKLPEADFERLERGLENAKIGAGDSV